jgi:hypothetical protein
MTAAQRSPGAPKAAPKFKQPSAFARQKRLIEAAQEAALDRAARSVLLHASVYMDIDGWAFPSSTSLVETTGYTEKSVRKALREIRDAGIVVSLVPAAWQLALKATPGANTPKGGKLPLMLFWPAASMRARVATLGALSSKPRAIEQPKAPAGPFTITVEGKEYGPHEAADIERFARTREGAAQWTLTSPTHPAPCALEDWYWFGAHLPFAPSSVRG